MTADQLRSESAPQSVDRHDMEAILERVRALPRVQGDSREEPLPHRRTQLAQANESVARDAVASFDLEGDDGAVVALENQVDLVTVVGPPMAVRNGVVEPARLLQQLGDDERLEQVPELRERRGLESREPRRCQTQ